MERSSDYIASMAPIGYVYYLLEAMGQATSFPKRLINFRQCKVNGAMTPNCLHNRRSVH